MPTYVVLFNWTEQGAKGIKDLPARVEANKKRLKEWGIEVRSWHMTQGRYDVIAICDAPDDATFARATLAIAAQGNARTETLRAFDEAEVKKIVASLP